MQTVTKPSMKAAEPMTGKLRGRDIIKSHIRSDQKFTTGWESLHLSKFPSQPFFRRTVASRDDIDLCKPTALKGTFTFDFPPWVSLADEEFEYLLLPFSRTKATLT